jgi:DNA-binding transcriptional MerR regulator
MMSDPERAGDDELLAIPRLAERVGVTPRVLRYWEEQGLISPTREHGKLRYSPRDVAIAALIRRLLAAGAGVEGVRMLKRLAERDIRRSSAAGDQVALIEDALRILYQRKAFREETGMDEEHYPEGKPPPPPRHGGPPRGPGGPGGPRPRKGEARSLSKGPSGIVKMLMAHVLLQPDIPAKRHWRSTGHSSRLDALGFSFDVGSTAEPSGEVYDDEPRCPLCACQEHKPRLSAAGDHSAPAAVWPGSGETGRRPQPELPGPSWCWPCAAARRRPKPLCPGTLLASVTRQSDASGARA